MKRIILAVVCFLGLVSVKAQMGQNQVNVGLGINSWEGFPVYVGVDHFLKDEISIGAEASYLSLNKYKELDHSISVFGLGVNGNYHFDRILKLPSEWNLYGGLNLSYFKWSYENSNYGGLDLGIQVGARYYFSENLGVNLQFGGASNVSGGRLGVTFKL